MAPFRRNAKTRKAARHTPRIEKFAHREQIAQIGLAIAECFPGLIPRGVDQGKTIADLASSLIEKLARISSDRTREEVYEAMRQTG